VALSPPDNQWLGDLALIDVKTERVRVLSPEVRSIWYRLAPDGRRLAYLDYKGKRAGPVLREAPTFATYVSNLVVLDISTGHKQVVMPQVEQYWYPIASWSPDGRWLATLSGSSVVNPDNYSVRGDLYVVASDGGSSRPIRGAPPHAFGTMVPPQVLWDSASAHIYLTDEQRVWRATIGTARLAPMTLVSSVKPAALVQLPDRPQIWRPDGDDGIYLFGTDSLTLLASILRLDLSSGKLTAVRQEAKQFLAWYVNPPLGARTGGRVVFRAESEAESEDLWIAERGFEQLSRLTTLNPGLARYTFGTSRVIDFRSADGIPLHGALLLPSNYVPGHTYPLITLVYPGALGSSNAHGFGFSGSGAPQLNMQMWSTRGYAVLYPDMPVRLMSDFMKTVMPAIDQVIALGIADPDRLAVMGHSAGGYATLGLLVQTTRFKAAIALDGMSNLTSFYGTLGPVGVGKWTSFLETVGGPRGAPWEVPQRYIENSPIFYLDRVQTPLLIGVGGADEPFVSQMNEAFVGLQRLGREVTYVRYEGEGHFLVQANSLTDYWTRALAFFETHLQDH
jgi:dipeptidyl aminopeptidase/acylaminoacyl peptidase